MTLSAARDAHMTAKRELGIGRDPMAARKADKQADAMTFNAVSEKWFKHWKPAKTPKHASDVWRRLEMDIFPTLGSVPAKDLTAAQVRDCIKAIEKRGALDIAKRQLQKCSQIMRYAVAHDLAERNPGNCQATCRIL